MATDFRLNKAKIFELCNYTPHEAQLKIHQSDHPRKVAAAGVRSGKTVAAAMEALCAALEPGEYRVVWCVGPTYELANRVFREVCLKIHTYFGQMVKSESQQDHKLIIHNLGGGLTEIRAKSADNPKSLLGEGVDFMVIDEASRMSRDTWETFLSTRLLDKRGKCLMISSPNGKNYFYELYCRGQNGDDPDWISWNFPSRVNPILPKEAIEAERQRLPAGVFRSEYEAAFVEGAGQVFRHVRECATLIWLDSKGIPPDLGNPPYQSAEKYVAGLDVAQTQDWTVLVIMDSLRRVVYVDRFQKLPWDAQVRRIKATLDRYNRCEVLTDSTGVGSAVVEQLQNAGVRVRGYKFSSGSKAELMGNLSMLLERGEITLPSSRFCPVLISELESYAYDVTDSGVVRMRAPHGQHDDTVCALALAAWRARPTAIARGRIAGGQPTGSSGSSRIQTWTPPRSALLDSILNPWAENL